MARRLHLLYYKEIHMKLSDVLISSLDGLIEASFNDVYEDEASRAYCHFIIAQKRGDRSAIEAMSFHENALTTLKKIYLSDDQGYLDSVALSVGDFSSRFHGELYFSIAHKLEELGELVQAQSLYKAAYKSYQSQNCSKRAIECLFFFTRISASIQSDFNTIAEFEFVLKRAIKANELSLVGMCHLAMAQEYKRLKCYEVALEHITSAIGYMEDEKGAELFYRALLHRSHLLILLGFKNQARFDYQKVVAAKMKVLQPTLRNIRNLLDSSEMIKLTKSEKRLVEALMKNPMSKKDLIIRLYGNKIDWFAADSRFKMLLSRLRKKDSTLVFEKQDLFHVRHDYDIDGSSMPHPLQVS